MTSFLMRKAGRQEGLIFAFGVDWKSATTDCIGAGWSLAVWLLI
jgi:hypothetical protein